jgi:hypothetical protein
MVTISKYYSSVTKTGVKPSNPGNVVTVIPEVLNPPDSPVNHSPVTIGSPANGLSLVGQELSLGLASSGVTGALSGTDWSAFNGKVGGTILSGQVAFGTGVNTIGGDSGLLFNSITQVLTTTADAVVNGVNIGRGGGAISSNTRVGTNALQNNTTGNNNTANGVNALRNNTTGNNNTANGVSALRNNTTGGSNTANGLNALYNNTTGSNNTANGSAALFNNISGASNTANGVSAGRFLANGSTALTIANNSVFLGVDTRANANSETNQIVIGHTAIGGGSNTVVIGNSSILSNRFFGTLRVGTISNASGNFLTTSATGVVQQRTATETRTDIGAFPSASLSIASGQVAFGTGVNTVGGDSGLTWDNVNKRLGIGTVFPTVKLTINDSNPNNGVLCILRNTAGSNRTGSQIQITQAGLADWVLGQPPNINAFSFWSGRNNISGGTEIIRMHASGNVQIGTTTDAGFRLDVNGTARVQGALRIGTISNAVGNFLTTSATGVVQQRTAGETASDIGAVTITGTQTITGAKTFDNSLLVLSGTSATFRIASNNNIAALNFRANNTEEKATLEFNDSTNAFSIATRVNNSDLSITPHGTGKIKLSNVPSGTGDVLMRDASNNLVVGSGTPVTETTSTFTPTLVDSGGGATYTYSSYFAECVKTGNTITFEIRFLGVNSSGTPSGANLYITALPFAIDPSARFSFSFSQFTGSSYSSAQLGDVIGVLVEQVIFVTTLNGSISLAPTFISGAVRISGTYYI